MAAFLRTVKRVDYNALLILYSEDTTLDLVGEVIVDIKQEGPVSCAALTQTQEAGPSNTQVAPGICRG